MEGKSHLATFLFYIKTMSALIELRKPFLKEDSIWETTFSIQDKPLAVEQVRVKVLEVTSEGVVFQYVTFPKMSIMSEGQFLQSMRPVPLASIKP